MPRPHTPQQPDAVMSIGTSECRHKLLSMAAIDAMGLPAVPVEVDEDELEGAEGVAAVAHERLGCGACGHLTAVVSASPARENTSPRSAGAADRASPRCCMVSSHSMPAERAVCLPRQAGLLRIDHGDTLATVERIGIDIDGLGRYIRTTHPG